MTTKSSCPGCGEWFEFCCCEIPIKEHRKVSKEILSFHNTPHKWRPWNELAWKPEPFVGACGHCGKSKDVYIHVVQEWVFDNDED